MKKFFFNSKKLNLNGDAAEEILLTISAINGLFIEES